MRQIRLNSKDPFGDTAFIKLRYINVDGMVISSGTNITFATNNLNTLSAKPFGFTGPLPPGQGTWATIYQHYEVWGIKFRAKFRNLGVYTNATDALSALPIGQNCLNCAISAEGDSEGTTNPITTAAYWDEDSIRNQRWAKYGIMGPPSGDKSARTLQAFYGVKQFNANKSQRNMQNLALINWSGVPGAAGTYTDPPLMYKFGYAISTVGDENLPAGNKALANVEWTVIYYVRYSNRRPSTSIP